MSLIPSKGKLALIGAAGLMAVLYAKRQQRTNGLTASADGTQGSLASLVAQPGPAGEPIPAQANRWQTTDAPTAEDPYEEDHPTVLPTGPAPGG